MGVTALQNLIMTECMTPRLKAPCCVALRLGKQVYMCGGVEDGLQSSAEQAFHLCKTGLSPRNWFPLWDSSLYAANIIG